MSNPKWANTCYVCGGYLPASYMLGSAESWYCKNVAPDAAGGGTMVPVHHRCAPVDLRYIPRAHGQTPREGE